MTRGEYLFETFFSPCHFHKEKKMEIFFYPCQFLKEKTIIFEDNFHIIIHELNLFHISADSYPITFV